MFLRLNWLVYMLVKFINLNKKIGVGIFDCLRGDSMDDVDLILNRLLMKVDCQLPSTEDGNGSPRTGVRCCSRRSDNELTSPLEPCWNVRPVVRYIRW